MPKAIGVGLLAGVLFLACAAHAQTVTQPMPSLSGGGDGTQGLMNYLGAGSGGTLALSGKTPTPLGQPDGSASTVAAPSQDLGTASALAGVGQAQDDQTPGLFPTQ
ncbi:MAG: hypothetical protein U1E45_24125 [Geminicoccaceae bacterium]